jgi:hypothetical protein
MSKPDLHLFKDDLRKKPSDGSNAPPRSIKAQDLDENFVKTSVIAPLEDPPSYTVEYTREGTRLKISPGLPEGAVAREFDVCENGQPVQYWFVTWDEQPEIE